MDYQKFLREKILELNEKFKKGECEPSYQIGAASYTEKEWDNLLEKRAVPRGESNMKGGRSSNKKLRIPVRKTSRNACRRKQVQKKRLGRQQRPDGMQKRHHRRQVCFPARILRQLTRRQAIRTCRIITLPVILRKGFFAGRQGRVQDMNG